MNRQLTFRQYRGIDLTLFAIILCVTESVLVMAANKWFADQLYTVSVSAAIVCIVLMRWGPYAAIHAVLAGLVYCLAAHGTGQQYLIYCVGNLFGLGGLILVKTVGDKGIRANSVLSVAYALAVQLLMQLGRGVMALLLGYGLDAAFRFLTTDALSTLFTVVIIWIARRLDGIFEDQKSYLFRVQAEKEEEKGGY